MKKYKFAVTQDRYYLLMPSILLTTGNTTDHIRVVDKIRRKDVAVPLPLNLDTSYHEQILAEELKQPRNLEEATLMPLTLSCNRLILSLNYLLNTSTKREFTTHSITHSTQ